MGGIIDKIIDECDEKAVYSYAVYGYLHLSQGPIGMKCDVPPIASSPGVSLIQRSSIIPASTLLPRSFIKLYASFKDVTSLIENYTKERGVP